ncbi:hypothetical protein I79_010090 [Cricetulus griseus]|uniref:Uncharacterized protein n=1 Tax=Cricetulus griseus TaxID=10029 RepID=G3HHH3_CRIGR|nr:hypothetical protein I79_010090 [Cricetulus griseus]
MSEKLFTQLLWLFVSAFNKEGDVEILLEKYLEVSSVSYANAINIVSLGKLISVYFLSLHLSI